MPPRRYKVNHHKDKGSSYAGFLERNAEVLPDSMLRKRNAARKQEESESEDHSSGSDSEQKSTKPAAPKVVAARSDERESEDDDAQLTKEFGREAGTAETRKEREARLAAEAKKRYDELHMAGKTPEAKADLARLAEIRKKREDAAAKAKKDAEEKEASRSRGRASAASADYLKAAFM
jgi:hypothetical protein